MEFGTSTSVYFSYSVMPLSFLLRFSSDFVWSNGHASCECFFLYSSVFLPSMEHLLSDLLVLLMYMQYFSVQIPTADLWTKLIITNSVLSFLHLCSIYHFQYYIRAMSSTIIRNICIWAAIWFNMKYGTTRSTSNPQLETKPHCVSLYVLIVTM